MLPLPCMLVCTFVCANRTRDRGCSKHPVFPAPSEQEGGKLSSKPRAISAARMRSCGFVGWVERSETHQMPMQGTMGIASLHPSYGGYEGDRVAPNSTPACYQGCPARTSARRSRTA